MTDLEITRLCAEAVKIAYFPVPKMFVSSDEDCAIYSGCHENGFLHYDPLNDDEQAMALVKQFKLDITATFSLKSPRTPDRDGWRVCDFMGTGKLTETWDEDLNRAICICVAQIQAAK